MFLELLEIWEEYIDVPNFAEVCTYSVAMFMVNVLQNLS